ncbi:MAG: hypothetical protein ACFFD7_04150 [Candidatus Thorarchaeota archaeon]
MIELVASIYIIVIGLAMFIMWTFLLGKREIPELSTKPTQIYFHLIAELLTSVLLITGGIGLIMNQPWGLALFFISIGMAIYSTINAAGFYGQLKDWPMFIILISFSIISLIFAILILLVGFQIL